MAAYRSSTRATVPTLASMPAQASSRTNASSSRARTTADAVRTTSPMNGFGYHRAPRSPIAGACGERYPRHRAGMRVTSSWPAAAPYLRRK